MKTIAGQLREAFAAAIITALGEAADPQIGPAQNEKFGDYQCNAAMGLGKQIAQRTGQKTNPRQIAEKIIGALQLGDRAEVSIAGAGFINIRLKPAWVVKGLQALGDDQRVGVEKTRSALKVVVDYSGPNVAKELHVGHLRSSIIGDAICRVLAFEGHEVVRQNHLGDWGTQFGMLIEFMNDGAATGGQLADLEQFYRAAKERYDSDAEFAARARARVVALQAGDAGTLKLWKVIVDESRRHFEVIYRRLGVLLRAEDERGESFYNNMLAGVVSELLEKGIATESAEPVALEEEEEVGAAVSDRRIVIFTAGVKAPLVIRKTDGGYLYATTDLAAIKYRVQTLGAGRLIYTHDARQTQRFGQLFDAAARAAWGPGAVMEFAPFGTMLGEDGKPFKTRSGGTVKLKELLDEAEERALAVVTAKNVDLQEEERKAIAHAVGIGAVKYADLAKDRVSDYVFSWDKMLAMDGNTAPYLQYVYARIRSIFRKAGAAQAAGTQLTLESAFELALAVHILRLGEIVEAVARDLKPHHLCAYLYDLATRFSAFYENCPVLQSAEPLRSSRLLLCDLTGRTMALGLDLLGIEHPEQM